MTVYPVTQSDTFSVVDPTLVNSTYHTFIDDDITIPRGVPIGTLGVQLSTTVTIAPTVAILPQWGAGVDDDISITHTQTQMTTYHVTEAEAAKFLGQFQIAFPASLSDSLTISPAQSIAIGWLVLDQFVVKDSSLPSTTFAMTLLDALQMSTSLADFFGLSADDGINVHHSQVMNYVASAALSSLITIAPTLTTSLIMQVVENDMFDITDAQILQMIYHVEIDDFVDLSALYVSPDGNFTTWAINTRTSSVTEYQNFAFNSFAQMGRKFIAASSTGIYELDGDQDPGAVNIATAMKSGFFAPNGSKFTSFRNIYIGIRTNDDQTDFLLKLCDSYGREYIYSFHPNLNATTKINTGKGLRARFFSFELMTPGPDFDLSFVEFRPIMLKRRI